MNKERRIAIAGTNLGHLTKSLWGWATENEAGELLEQRKREIVADLKALIALIEES